MMKFYTRLITQISLLVLVLTNVACFKKMGEQTSPDISNAPTAILLTEPEPHVSFSTSCEDDWKSLSVTFSSSSGKSETTILDCSSSTLADAAVTFTLDQTGRSQTITVTAQATLRNAKSKPHVVTLTYTPAPSSCLPISIMAGGATDITGHGITNKVYMTADGASWTEMASLPVAVNLNMVGYIDGKFVSVGGMDSNEDVLDTIFTSTDGSSWTTAGAFPVPIRRMNQLLNYNNKLWMMGGAGEGEGDFTDLVYSSSDGVNWTVSGQLPMVGAAVTFFEGKFWAVGGFENSVLSVSNHVYSSTDGVSWTLENTLPSGRIFGNLVSFNNQLYYISGYDNTLHGNTEILRMSGGVWSSIANLPVDLSIAGSIFVFGNALTIYGGYSEIEDGYHFSSYTSTDGVNWSQGTIPTNIIALGYTTVECP